MADEKDLGKLVAELWNKQDQVSEALTLLIDTTKTVSEAQDTVNETILEAVKELGEQMVKLSKELSAMQAKLEVHGILLGNIDG